MLLCTPPPFLVGVALFIQVSINAALFKYKLQDQAPPVLPPPPCGHPADRGPHATPAGARGPARGGPGCAVGGRVKPATGRGPVRTRAARRCGHARPESPRRAGGRYATGRRGGEVPRVPALLPPPTAHRAGRPRRGSRGARRMSRPRGTTARRAAGCGPGSPPPPHPAPPQGVWEDCPYNHFKGVPRDGNACRGARTTSGPEGLQPT